jgi:hypothetical protein
VTFVCLLTRPAIGQPTRYCALWVNRLWAGLRRHHAGPLHLVCLTDQPEGIRAEVDCRPLPDPSLVTWWQRLTLFRPDVAHGIADGERFTNLDLDTVVVGPVAFLHEPAPPFIGARDWGHRAIVNGGLWTLTPGHYETVWEAFDKDRAGVMRRWDDQEFISHVTGIDTFYQDTHPSRVWSYKWGHVGERRQSTPLPACPAGASLIATHGRPKPDDLPEDHWLRLEWERE